MNLVRGEPGEDLWSDPDRWPEIRLIREEIVEVRRVGLEAQLKSGQPSAALPELAVLAEAEPVTEWVQDLFMRALYLAGRPSEAVTAYRRFQAAVTAELGLEPGPAISQNYRMILTDDPALLPVRDVAEVTRPTSPRETAAVGTSPAEDVEALLRAGDFAAAQGGFGVAVDCYRSLVSVQSDPAERARMLLRLGEAAYHASGTGHEELTEAAALFHGEGDHARTAEALSWRARGRWLMPVNEDPVEAQLAQILDLVDRRRPGPAGTAALVNACGLLAVTGQPQAARRIGLLALAWARRLALAPLELRARSNLAMIAVDAGDATAAQDLVAVLDTYRSRSVWVPPALLVTLADAQERARLLAAARAHRVSARRAARSRGNISDLAWLAAERVGDCFQLDRWNEATTSAQAFLTGPQRGHRMAGNVHLVLGRIAAIRGDLSVAVRHADAAVRSARHGGGRSALGPAMALRLHLAVRAGQPSARTRPLLDELLTLIKDRSLSANFGAELPLALAAAGVRRVDLAAHRPAESVWLQALEAVLEGKTSHASLLYQRIGSPGDARQIALSPRN